MSEIEPRWLLASLSKARIGFPRILSVAEDTSMTRIRIEVPEDLCWFGGHFPGYPVLPGIVQLHWAVCVCRRLYGFECEPAEIRRLKFMKVVIPPRELELAVSRPTPAETRFAFSSLGEQNARGTLVFDIGEG